MLAGSPNFSVAEVTRASSSVPKATLNTEPYVSNIARALTAMEAVRATLGHVPIEITSMVRSAAHNEDVGGAEASHHLVGNAVDFKPLAGLTASEAFEVLRQPGALRGLKLDELVGYDSHIHISVDRRARGKVIDKRTAATAAPTAKADATATAGRVPFAEAGRGCAVVLFVLAAIGLAPLAAFALSM
jgi:hypothetical protein